MISIIRLNPLLSICKDFLLVQTYIDSEIILVNDVSHVVSLLYVYN